MTMVKRDATAEKQIAAAKVMPNAQVDESDERSPDSDIVTAAEAPVAGRAGAAADKPGYRG